MGRTRGLGRDAGDKDQMVDRACVSCPHTWNGDISCPECGEPGEPLERDNSNGNG